MLLITSDFCSRFIARSSRSVDLRASQRSPTVCSMRELHLWGGGVYSVSTASVTYNVPCTYGVDFFIIINWKKISNSNNNTSNWKVDQNDSCDAVPNPMTFNWTITPARCLMKFSTRRRHAILYFYCYWFPRVRRTRRSLFLPVLLTSYARAVYGRIFNKADRALTLYGDIILCVEGKETRARLAHASREGGGEMEIKNIYYYHYYYCSTSTTVETTPERDFNWNLCRQLWRPRDSWPRVKYAKRRERTRRVQCTNVRFRYDVGRIARFFKF